MSTPFRGAQNAPSAEIDAFRGAADGSVLAFEAFRGAQKTTDCESVLVRSRPAGPANTPPVPTGQRAQLAAPAPFAMPRSASEWLPTGTRGPRATAVLSSSGLLGEEARWRTRGSRVRTSWAGAGPLIPCAWPYLLVEVDSPVSGTGETATHLGQ